MVPGGTCADIPRTPSPAKNNREKRKVNEMVVFRLPPTSKYDEWKLKTPRSGGKVLIINMDNGSCA